MEAEIGLPALIISGPSGTGKSTIISKLLKDNPDIFQLSISYTTRKPRENEIHGRHYFFVTKEEFQKEVDKNLFLEHVTYAGNQYGTHVDEVKKISKNKKICLLDIDIEGGKLVFGRKDIKTNFMFIYPPSAEEQEKRLRKRTTDSEIEIKKRLDIGKIEIEKVLHNPEYSMYEHKLINDVFEETIKNVYEAIAKLYPTLLIS